MPIITRLNINCLSWSKPGRDGLASRNSSVVGTRKDRDAPEFHCVVEREWIATDNDSPFTIKFIIVLVHRGEAAKGLIEVGKCEYCSGGARRTASWTGAHLRWRIGRVGHINRHLLLGECTGEARRDGTGRHRHRWTSRQVELLRLAPSQSPFQRPALVFVESQVEVAGEILRSRRYGLPGQPVEGPLPLAGLFIL